MIDSDSDWHSWIQKLRDGDDDACREFYEQFAPMIERLAERNLSDGLRQRVGADDVVQSACRTDWSDVHASHSRRDE